MSMADEQRAQVALAMKWALGLATRADVEREAVAAVEAGKEHPDWMNLALLFIGREKAAHDLDVERALADVLRHAGIPEESREERALRQLEWILTAILDGSVLPHEGARAIWWTLLSDLPSMEEDLNAFVADASDWDDAPDFRPAIEDQIRDDARSLLARLRSA